MAEDKGRWKGNAGWLAVEAVGQFLPFLLFTIMLAAILAGLTLLRRADEA